jgi:hypothetical protein
MVVKSPKKDFDRVLKRTLKWKLKIRSEVMDTITIFTAKYARRLLKENFRIVDIKPNNTNKDRSVFIFEKTKELVEFMHKHDRLS